MITEVVSALTILMFGGGFSGADLGSIAGVLGTGLLCAVLWALIGSGLGLFTGSMVGSVLAICAWVPFGELTVSLVLHGMGLGGVAQFLPARSPGTHCSVSSTCPARPRCRCRGRLPRSS